GNRDRETGGGLIARRDDLVPDARRDGRGLARRLKLDHHGMRRPSAYRFIALAMASRASSHAGWSPKTSGVRPHRRIWAIAVSTALCWIVRPRPASIWPVTR